jgi:hypothetical protein
MFFTTVNFGQSRSWQNHGLSSLAGVWLAGLAASAAEAAHSTSRHNINLIVQTSNVVPKSTRVGAEMSAERANSHA